MNALLRVTCIVAIFGALSGARVFAHGDEARPGVSFGAMNNTYAYEPREGRAATPVRFTVTRSGPTELMAERATFFLEYWGTSDASDYEAAPKQITLPGGVSSYTFEVWPRADGLAEGTESIQAQIVPPLPHFDDADGKRRSYSGAFATVAAQIVDADGPPTGVVYSIEAEVDEVREPGPGQSAVEARVIVSRSETAAEGRVRLAYAGTAGAADYEAGATELVFATGVSNLVASIKVNGDEAAEKGESVIARILPWRAEFGGERYLIASGRNAATIRIMDRVPAPAGPTPLGKSVFSIETIVSATTEPGPNHGVFPALVRVSRTGELRGLVEAKIRRSGTATTQDYWMEVAVSTRRVEGGVFFGSGVAAVDVEIWAKGDSASEGDEAFWIELVASANYELEPGATRAAILIHDAEEPMATTGMAMIVAPEDGAELAGEMVEVRTVIEHPSGGFERVEYFDAGEKVGEVGTEAGFGRMEQVFRWSGVPNGRHAIEARAVDGEGGVLASQVVQFSITNQVPRPERALRILGLSRPGSGVLRLEASGAAGAVLRLESSPDLREWKRRAPMIPQDAEAKISGVPIDVETNEFFRLVSE